MDKQDRPEHAEDQKSQVSGTYSLTARVVRRLISQPEKQLDASALEEDSSGREFVFDEKRSNKLNRRLDFRLLPLLCWVYLLNFLDRGNIGNAR